MRIQYLTVYRGGDPHQPYRVNYSGQLSSGLYTRYVGDEARALYRYRRSDEGTTSYEQLDKEGLWVHSDRIVRYVLLGSSDLAEEIDLEEAKRIATILGFPEAV